ncbi:MAG TPA: YafY family protein [Rhodothermales bacterium]|nr:YafY family protein [Rhodothermales bacterium]
MNQTDRMLGIVLALQDERWQRAIDLAERLNVSQRTIYRDVEALRAADVPVVSVPGKGYSLHEEYVLPALKLTTDEAVVLLLGTDAVEEQLDAHYRPAARTARTKIEAILPDRLRSEVTALQNSIRFVPVNAFDNPDEQHALHRLREALTGQRTVQFGYHERVSGDGVPGGDRVDPYGLVHLGGAWYLVGYCHQRERVRHFRLSQMGDVTVLDETFERPAGYQLPKHEPSAQRDIAVRVLFDRAVARWVQEAPSVFTEATEMRPEGLLVTLKVERETEVLPWLLSWGGHAQVLEPASLQRRLAHEAEKIAARYQAAPMLLS